MVGGEATRLRLERLLGVEALRRDGARVSAVAWVGEHLEVEVVQPGEGDPIVVQLERHRAGRPCFLELGAVDLFYRGAGLDPRLEAALRAVAPRAFRGATVEVLAELLGRDPDAGRPGEPLPRPDESGQADYDDHALLSSWGSPSVWTSFFATAEVARSQLDSLDFFERCSFVQHCDAECLAVNPQTGVPMVPLVLYPWDDRLRRLAWGRAAPRPERDEDSPGMVTTDLDERDVILGLGAERLRAVLEHQSARARGEMAFCSCTCVPVVAGEDVEAVVEAVRDRFEIPLLFLTTTPESMQGVFRDLLITRRLAAEARAAPPRPDAVNLIGFPVDPSHEEIRLLLHRIGLDLNVSLLPALSPGLVDRLPEAALNVVHPNALWRGLHDQIQRDSRVAAVEPTAPFGVEGTLRWLVEVARAAGVDSDPAAAVEAELRAVRPRWDELRAAATGHRLGLVLREAEAHLVGDPAQTWGLPLAAVLDEMGFGLDVLVHTTDRGSPALAAIEAALPATGRHRVAPFETPEALGRMLDPAALSAVYSEQLYDRRLTESGLPGFSGQAFERGLGGAVRSLERLLEICRAPFHRRYGRHLRAAARTRGLPGPFEAARGGGGPA